MAFFFGKGKDSSQKKEKVKTFMNWTQSCEEDALSYLKKVDWNLDSAVDNYFNHPPLHRKKSSVKIDTKNLEKIFEQYKDPETGIIEDEALDKFMKDVNMAPDDEISLIFAWRLNAQHLGEFSKEEFVEGLSNLRWDTLQKIKEGLPVLRKHIEDENNFKQFYQYIWGYARNSKESKIIDYVMAVELWKMILPGKFPLLNDFLEFLEKNYKKPINRDNWNILLEFAKTIKPDLSNYDCEAAWPTLFDEFTEWFKEEKLGIKPEE